MASHGVATIFVEDLETGVGDRVAMISLHTSPLDQPGTGDAGGMNVYVIELSRRLAQQGVAVDVFTRATSSSLPQVVEAADGVLVRHIAAGPLEGLAKVELPGQLCTFAREVLRAEAVQPAGHYAAVHSHYWLSGQVGALARDRWNVPLVHSMHTMAKVKNRALAAGDSPEPLARFIGEEQVVAAADLLVANTDTEAGQLVDLYGARPEAVEVIHPGVDLTVFRHRDRAGARRELGLPEDAVVLLFAGRIQPLKAPDVLLRAVGVLVDEDPTLRRRLVVPVVGGPSGSGLEHPESLAELAAALGIDDVVRFPSRSPGWRSGRPRPPRSPSRPTTSPSAWSPSRRRRPAPLSWPPPSAGSPRSCATASAGCSSTPTSRATGRPPCAASSTTGRWRNDSARGPCATPRTSRGSGPPSGRWWPMSERPA